MKVGFPESPRPDPQPDPHKKVDLYSVEKTTKEVAGQRFTQQSPPQSVHDEEVTMYAREAKKYSNATIEELKEAIEAFL